MANNTALRAGKDTTRTITFKNKEHENFITPICQSADIRMYTTRHWCIVSELTGIQEKTQNRYTILRQDT